MTRAAPNPIFVVGMPRSGTTMLQHVLTRHPDVAIAPETHYLNRWVRRYGHLDLARADHFGEFWEAFSSHPRFEWLDIDAEATRRRITDAGPPTFRSVFAGVLAEYAASRGRSVAGEKTPGHYPHVDVLLEWFPDARVLFLVRDPRAVAASFATHTREWARRHGVDQVARRWATSAAIASGWSAEPRVELLRYEDLVGDQEASMKVVAEFLEIDLGHLLATPERPDDRVWIHGSHDPRGDVSAGSVERWRDALSARQIALTEYLTDEGMQRFGYERSASQYSTGVRLRALTTRVRSSIHHRVGRLGRHR